MGWLWGVLPGGVGVRECCKSLVWAVERVGVGALSVK